MLLGFICCKSNGVSGSEMCSKPLENPTVIADDSWTVFQLLRSGRQVKLLGRAQAGTLGCVWARTATPSPAPEGFEEKKKKKAQPRPWQHSCQPVPSAFGASPERGTLIGNESFPLPGLWAQPLSPRDSSCSGVSPSSNSLLVGRTISLAPRTLGDKPLFPSACLPMQPRRGCGCHPGSIFTWLLGEDWMLKPQLFLLFSGQGALGK